MARSDGGGLLTLSGVLAGAAIGAAVGLVYSPGTGEENRKRLSEWTRARFDETRNKVYEQVEQAFNTVRVGLEGVVNQAQERVEAVKSEAEGRIEAIRDEAQDATSGVQADMAAGMAREEGSSC